MFKSITRFGAAVIATLGLALPSAASTFSIDYSDLWGGGQPQPTENGWGLNLIQQGDIIFATMFVYGSDNTARWFSASSLAPSGGSTTWTGQLAQTSGPYFGATWNNSQVVPVVVGTMTVTFASATAGTLQYTVNGVQVTKSISRFTLRGPNMNGRYIGGAVATCSNGGDILIFDKLRVTQNGTSVNMTVEFADQQLRNSTCTYNGTLAVNGRTGSIQGNYSCIFGTQAGNAGTFSITNLETSNNGFTGTYQASDQFCSSQTGRFGGVKDVLL